jgi:hypothetical protein
MGRIVAVFLAALLGPFLFVAAYLVVAHLGDWHVGPTGDKITQLGGVLAGVAPIFLARGSLWVKGLLAAIYAIPCTMAVGFYSLLLSCSMFRQCLS